MNVDDLLKSKVGQLPGNRQTLQVAKAQLGGLAPVTPLDKPQDTEPTVLPEWMPNPSKYFDEVSPAYVICKGVLLGEPIAKQRARIGKFGAYTPAKTKQFQKQIAATAIGQLTLPPKPDIALGIRVAFYTQTHQRKDVDNMLKSVMDALNHLAFCDDSQIKEVMAWSAVDCSNPRTEFLVYRLGGLGRDKGFCIQCLKPFVLTKDWHLRLFCSRECWIKSKGDSRIGKCTHCGGTMLLHHEDQKFCSVRCKGLAERTGFVKLVCAYCGTKFEVRPSDAARGTKFCSRSCYGKWMLGKPARNSKGINGATRVTK